MNGPQSLPAFANPRLGLLARSRVRCKPLGVTPVLPERIEVLT